MRIHQIACAAISIAAGAGCSGELAKRPAANDPTNVAAVEAPFHQSPEYEADPLVNPTAPKSAEAQPIGTEPAHSPTTGPPSSPPMRDESDGHTPAHRQDHGSIPGMHHDAPSKPPTTIYTCPMHPEVRASKPGQCPKCGMTLVPATPKAGEQ